MNQSLLLPVDKEIRSIPDGAVVKIREQDTIAYQMCTHIGRRIGNAIPNYRPTASVAVNHGYDRFFEDSSQFVSVIEEKQLPLTQQE